MEKRIRGRVKQMERSQRDYYLNEQMKAIQEMGDDSQSEVDELQQHNDLGSGGGQGKDSSRTRASSRTWRQCLPKRRSYAVID